MDLSAEIERIAHEQGRARDDLAHELGLAIRDAAIEAWGERELEAQLNAETNAVDLYQVVRVVEHVDPARATRELDLDAAGTLGGEPGEELMVQVFYRDEDADKAVYTAGQGYARPLPSLDVLAGGLPLGERPAWMRPLWPHRRMPWRFGRAVTLPSLPEALDLVDRFLDDAGAEVQRAGATAPQLERTRGLGPATSGLVALYERLGPMDEDGAEPLTWRGVGLCSIDDALAGRDLMNDVTKELRANGEVDEGWWSASWLPIFGGRDGATRYCLDLSTGAVLRWAKDVPERTLEAPSLEAWLGLIAVAAQSGLLTWEPKGMGLHPDYRVDPRVDQWLVELQRLALPGFPRAV